jgi:BirA family transcriptional regulator, biotin operon repressor / biotin---[acetyl-CoA-carboxylase] ligase
MEREPFDHSDFERLAGGWVASVFAHATLASTNDEASRLASGGAPEGTVVVADVQSAGRGRLDRTWVAEPGTSLLVSWIVRPSYPPDRWPLLALASGVAVASAVGGRGVDARLKWPNDVLAGGRKLAGILAEAGAGFVVVGLGLNVRQDSFSEELGATSLLLERTRPIGRARLLGDILERFAPFAADPVAALEPYRELCDTIGRRVRVERPGSPDLEGTASSVGDRGELVVDGIAIAAGDVVHLR